MGLYAAGTATLMSLHNKRHEIIDSLPDVDAVRRDQEVVFVRKEF